MSDPSKELTLRVHDECNGSDVFGSDICTCKPYLIFAIEECVRTAQRGGVGVVVYFRKEGRALGEVTKSVHFCPDGVPVKFYNIFLGTSFTTSGNVAVTARTSTSSRQN